MNNIKYVGTLRNTCYGLDLNTFKLLELYNHTQLRVRKVAVNTSITIFKDAILKQLNTAYVDYEPTILNFINTAAQITPKLHQLHVIFKKPLATKLLVHRPYVDENDVYVKTKLDIRQIVATTLFKEMLESKPVLITLLAANYERKSTV